MRLTLRSQVSVCGRRGISKHVCVRALHCLWTRYPCAAAARRKNRLASGAHQPTREFPRAFVFNVIHTAHTHIHYYYTRTDVRRHETSLSA